MVNTSRNMFVKIHTISKRNFKWVGRIRPAFSIPKPLGGDHLMQVDSFSIICYTIIVPREGTEREERKMEFKKERNFINAYEGDQKLGGWNITTGQFIGKSGKPVKSVPNCFTYDHLYNFRHNLLTGAVKMYREYWMSMNHFYGDYTPARANRLEQMISVGIYPNTPSDLDSTVTLNKDLVKWIINNHRGMYHTGAVNRYIALMQYCPQLPENLPDWVSNTLTELIDENIPSSFFIPALRRAINEHWDILFKDYLYNVSGTIAKIISDYYNYSMTMWGQVNSEPNMLTHICKIRTLYKEYLDIHYNEVLAKNNDKPWLYLENELFKAYPLLTRDQFHAEAEAQHNCVESMYMERVKDGSTHVVVIRKKTDPNTSYITCEVNNQGEIIQYLFAFNRRVYDKDAQNFKELYQSFLYSSLVK